MSLKQKPERSGDYTAQPLLPPPVQNSGIVAEAEFIRLPRPKSRCPITGLSRTTLAELVDGGAVRAAKLRKRGSQRAITLIDRQSLLAYLRSQISETSRRKKAKRGSCDEKW
jgi:hypothetical protein